MGTDGACGLLFYAAKREMPRCIQDLKLGDVRLSTKTQTGNIQEITLL
jgi:hypothetical protein